MRAGTAFQGTTGAACFFAFWLLATAFPARAQFGASLSVQSEQRYRGVSVSDEKPAAQLTLSYDFAEGWYGGAMLGRMHFGPQSNSTLAQAYLGRVMALGPGLDAEAGFTHTHFPVLRDHDYSEAYVGLLSERWNARLHYAPHYLGHGRRSLYAEVNGHWPLMATTLQAFAHAGLLHSPTEGYRRNPDGPTRLDLRAGLGWRQQQVEFQLAWVGVRRGGPSYPSAQGQRRSTLVLGAQLSF